MSDTDLRELQRKSDTGDVDARKQLYRAKRRSGILPTWDELKSHFADIIFEAEGPSKSKSGIINIRVDSCSSENACIYIELGTYDIGDCPSWTNIGPFSTFEEGQKATANKLEELLDIMKKEKEEDAVYCPDCGGPLDPYDLHCANCQYAFHDCEICGKVYGEESDAGDCCIPGSG